MIRHLKLVLIAAIVAFIAGCVTVPTSAPVSTGVSFEFFYSNLSPHGSWLVSADYGRVWQPDVYASGWNPYYDGHWVYTDLGWTWVSDYQWGAVPYHYGTWVLDAELGWVWVPGTIWAPAWVVFRTGPDYIGWAPVSPRFTLGVSVGFYEPRPEQFVFVSAGSFLSPRIRTAIVRDSRRGEIINNTQIINNITIENNVVVNRGPDVASVERASGRQVREVRIEEVARAAPGTRVDREQLRVDPRGERKLRVAEPVPETERVPSARAPETRPDESGAAEPRREARPRRPESTETEKRREVGSRESGPDRGPAVNAPETPPDEDAATEPQGNARPRGPEPKENERRRELRPREPGPEHGPDANAPQTPPDENKATKPPEKKRPHRPEQKQKKEKKHKPEQGNDDGQKPPSHLTR